MTVQKRLIVNADDLGRTADDNAAVAVAHKRGVVTSASLLVRGSAAREAVELAAAHPELGLGLQMDVEGGPPVVGAMLREARSQLAVFRELTGRLPTHLGGPKDWHRSPDVATALVTLSWETGLPLRSGPPWLGSRLRKEGIAVAAHVLEAFEGSLAPRDALLGTLKAVEPGVTEVRWARSGDAGARAQEVEALTSGEVRATVQALGITLIHFGQITGSMPA